MKTRIVVLAAAAALAGFTASACQLSAADMETYHRAVSPTLPFPERSSAFEKVIQACPNDPRLYAEFASLLVANRDFSGALAWADKGLKLAPENPTLNLRKGEALVASSQAKEALPALAKTPTTGESQFFRGLAYQLLEHHRPAQQCFLDAWNRGNQDPYVLYSLMLEDKDLGDKAAGVEHFKIMLARFPDSVWVHVLLGDAHFQKSEEVEARQEYLAALKLMPDLFEPNFRLAYLTFEAGEYGSAIEYYRRALAAKPRHTEANVYLGEALRRDHRLPEAITQLKRAIQLDAKVALAYTSLSKSQADTGRLADAVDTLCSAEKEFPGDSSFPAMRSRILAQMGKPDDARQAAQRAREIMDERLKKQSSVAQ
ncbi:MAG TPA: tetratricopeptide repeat protein [Bryobacteraceae bacterium]|jgi:tetratricopeptide (TPR) repeat protein|nr:tetratricopeptide repeat protein [Bryobacteraceae bacterium]